MVLFRDRSQELYQIFDRLKAQNKAGTTNIAVSASQQQLQATSSGNRHLDPTIPPKSTVPAVARFYECAQSFSHEIASCSEMIGNLAKLTQQQTVFDDQASEIASLTSIVKGKLSQMHDELADLSALKEEAMSAVRGGQQAQQHSDTVLNTLRSKLVHASQDFKNLLQQRTKKIKETYNRRNRFSSDRPASFESALFQQAAANTDSGTTQGASGGPMTLPHTQQHQLALQTTNVSHFRQRHEAVREIEVAVQQVSEMFNDFTRLVHEQEELVIRIDSNVEDSLTHVNQGSNELLRYLANLSSNRGLIIKIFMVLFAFLLFFGFVVVR